MSTVSHFDAVTHYSQAAEALINAAPTGQQAVRRASIQQFAETGFPHRRMEDWRFTPLHEVAAMAGTPAAEATAPAVEALLPEVEGLVITLVNGRLVEQPQLPAGVTLSVITNDQPLPNTFGLAVAEDADVFSHLNTAFFPQIIHLQVAAGTVVKTPVVLRQLTTGEADSFTAPRLLIDVAENAKIEFIETFQSVSDQAFLVNAVTELNVAEKAVVGYHRIQNESRTANHVSRLAAIQAEASRLHTTHIDLGAKLARHPQHLKLNGKECFAAANGSYIGHEQQHLENYLFIDHAQPQAQSEQLFRGILADRARGVFRGRIRVCKDAQQTDAAQSSKALLLSRTAKCNNMPQLEIYADDVKCSHGATVGELDKNSLFYLQARGIPKERAHAILTFAFVEEVIDRITFEPLRQAVTRHFEQALKQDLYL